MGIDHHEAVHLVDLKPKFVKDESQLTFEEQIEKEDKAINLILSETGET